MLKRRHDTAFSPRGASSRTPTVSATLWETPKLPQRPSTARSVRASARAGRQAADARRPHSARPRRGVALYGGSSEALAATPGPARPKSATFRRPHTAGSSPRSTPAHIYTTPGGGASTPGFNDADEASPEADLGLVDVTSLSVENVTLVDKADVGAQFSEYSQLDRLTVTKCNITNEALVTIAQHCPFIVHLEIRSCTGFSAAGLQELANHLCLLQTFKLVDCKEVVSTSTPDQCTALFAALGSLPRRLRHLSLERTPGFTDDMIKGLLDVSKNPTRARLALLHFDFTGNHDITDKALEFVGSFCPDLRVLCLSQCDQKKLTDNGLVSVAKGCLRLQSLNLAGCAQLSGFAVRAIASSCTGLLHLNLAGVAHVGDPTLAHIASQACHLHLSSVNVTGCDSLSYSALLAFVKACTKLSHLDVTMCSRLSNDNTVALAAVRPSICIIRMGSGYTNPKEPALVPGFEPPPREKQFASKYRWSTYKSTKRKDGPGGKKKGKKGR